MAELDVYEPLAVKELASIKSASECASMILRIDDVIAAGKAEMPAGPPKESGIGEEDFESEY